MVTWYNLRCIIRETVSAKKLTTKFSVAPIGQKMVTRYNPISG